MYAVACVCCIKFVCLLLPIAIVHLLAMPTSPRPSYSQSPVTLVKSLLHCQVQVVLEAYAHHIGCPEVQTNQAT